MWQILIFRRGILNHFTGPFQCDPLLSSSSFRRVFGGEELGNPIFLRQYFSTVDPLAVNKENRCEWKVLNEALKVSNMVNVGLYFFFLHHLFYTPVKAFAEVASGANDINIHCLFLLHAGLVI